MPALLLIIGVGVAVAFIAARASAGASEAKQLPPYDPSNPLDSWKKAVEVQLPPVSSAPDEKAENDYWADFYKKKGHMSPPPEYPVNWTEVGVAGDIPQMGRTEAASVIAALFEENDAQKLFSMADDLEEDGYPLAANRLRQKAFRVMAEDVGERDVLADARVASR